jgi:hypothetical protein
MTEQETGQYGEAGWCNGARPGSGEAMAIAVRAALDAAVALVRRGDRQGAREHCAAIVFDAQPLIAARPELLRGMLYALLMAHGFRLLSRVVLAMTGKAVHVALLPVATGPIASPRAQLEPGRTIYTLDPRWLALLSPDDAGFRQWCDALTGQRHYSAKVSGAASAKAPGGAPAARHLEPA